MYRKVLRKILYDDFKVDINVNGYDYILIEYDIPEKLYYNSSFVKTFYNLRSLLGLEGSTRSVVKLKANINNIIRALKFYKYLKEVGAKAEMYLCISIDNIIKEKLYHKDNNKSNTDITKNCYTLDKYIRNGGKPEKNTNKNNTIFNYLNVEKITVSEGDDDIYIMIDDEDEWKYNIVIDKRRKKIFVERLIPRENERNEKIYEIKIDFETQLNRKIFIELKEFIEKNFKLICKYNSWIGRTIGVYKRLR